MPLTMLNGMQQASSIRGDRYSFDVYLANGAKKPDLKRSFLRVVDFGFCIPITYRLEDGTIWDLFLESEVLDYIRAVDTGVKCIISFQVFWDGEQIAIARLYKEPKQNRK